MRTAPDHLKVAFLQRLFEGSAIVDAGSRCVCIPIEPSHLKDVIKLLNDVGASATVVGTDPVMVTLGVEEAGRIPLFNPQMKSKKYQEVASLAAPIVK
jgi:hypothetical protein